MYNNFFIALIIEILQVLKENQNFFKENKTSRLELLDKYKLPTSVKQVLSEIDSGQLLKEIHSLLAFKKSKRISSENKIFLASLNYLSDKFVSNIYNLPDNFHYLEYEKQLQLASEQLKSNSRLAKTLIDLLANHSYQELLNELQLLLNKTTNAPIVLVQTPVSLTSEQKIEIKENISQQTNSICTPVFQINQKLIGGMRIFINGVVTDNSWLKKINLITKITNN